MDNGRKGPRMERSDSRTTATPLSKGPESLNFDSRGTLFRYYKGLNFYLVEEKAKSKEIVDFVKIKTEGSQPNSKEISEKPQSAGVDEVNKLI